MGVVDTTATANETTLQTQLKIEKSSMTTRHLSAEMMAKVSSENAVVKFGKSAGRKTEYALFVVKESVLNMPGCASGRNGFVSVKAKTVEGVDMVKTQTKKATDKVTAK